MTTTYGRAIITSRGTPENSGVITSCSCNASTNANNNPPSTAATTRQRAKMTSAMQTHPRPFVMLSVKDPRIARVRNAPPAAISMPPTAMAAYRVAATDTPAASAASGFSPTARKRRPKPVERSTTKTTGAITRNVRYVSRYWLASGMSAKSCWNFSTFGTEPAPYLSRLMKSQHAMRSKVVPMPATCWLTPRPIASMPTNRPASRPMPSAATSPVHAEPDSMATRKPPNAPAYIVPSMPRLSSPARSQISSPSAARTSGVAMVSMAPTRAR